MLALMALVISSSPIEVGRVRVDAARELAIEAAPCKGGRRAVRAVTHEGGARIEGKKLGVDVACNSNESVYKSGATAFGGKGEGEASVSTESFRVTPERTAIIVTHEEGFEWITRTGILIDAGVSDARFPAAAA